ncbi:response regulator [Cellulomonas sp. McL0617]|uniref:response regulator n=1 Tax=Cellulomonas sp. McL0617 TaxID=3415675 RepID=UPI003CF05D16
MTRVLVVDDEPDELALLVRHLHRLDCEVIALATAEDALADEASLDVDVAFVDLRLPGMSGAELVAELRVRRPTLAVVVTSVLDTEDYPIAEAWLPKPFTGERVHQALVAALAAG